MNDYFRKQIEKEQQDEALSMLIILLSVVGIVGVIIGVII
jgi:hypothetical protein